MTGNEQRPVRIKGGVLDELGTECIYRTIHYSKRAWIESYRTCDMGYQREAKHVLMDQQPLQTSDGRYPFQEAIQVAFSQNE